MKRIDYICKLENLKIPKETLKNLVESSGQDLRQIINILQMWKNQNANFGSDFMKSITKDESVMINNFDAAQKLLNHGEKPLDAQYKTFRQKVDLFFIDHEMIPLLVQESYLGAMGDKKDLPDLERMAEAADMISLGD